MEQEHHARHGRLAKPVDRLSVLGTAVILVVYTCMWLGASDEADAWVRETDVVPETVTAARIACKVVTVLLTSWLWLLLLVALLVLMQDYVLVHMRGAQRQTAFQISFGTLRQGTVIISLLGSILATAMFAWVSARRSLVNRRHVTVETVRIVVSRSMLFNLALVLVTLILTYVFALPTEEARRTPASRTR